MGLRFAFAVNEQGDFQNKHFGDADKYIIYEYDSKRLVFIDEIENTKRDIDEETKHGSKIKGREITKYLKKFDVKVLISLQFGKNINIINKKFIPIIVLNSDINNTLKILEKNMIQIHEEVKNKDTNFELFKISNEILTKYSDN